MTIYDERSNPSFTLNQGVAIALKWDTGIVIDPTLKIDPNSDENCILVREDHSELDIYHEYMNVIGETKLHKFIIDDNVVKCQFTIKENKRTAVFNFIKRNNSDPTKDLQSIIATNGTLIYVYSRGRRVFRKQKIA